ncbi:Thioredoxin superfamily protein [Zea mays]|nr:Thioredoxin superfamily protein [Zea mays]
MRAFEMAAKDGA